MEDSSNQKHARKLSADERLKKNRERNKSHAKRARERKKNHISALKNRIGDLEDESMTLRAKVDARYTANVLLGLSNISGGSLFTLSSTEKEKGNGGFIKSSSSVCRDLDKLTEKHRKEILSQQQEIEDNQNSLLQQCTIQQEIRKKIELQMSETAAEQNEAFSAQLNGVEDAVLGSGFSGSGKNGKNGNGRGKYTPQERESIRRERNRIHAKKTRDKKKIFLESSEKIICSLEQDVHTLREYLVEFNLMSTEEAAHLHEKDRLARAQLETLKESSFDISVGGGVGSPMTAPPSSMESPPNGSFELIDIEDMEGSATFLNQLRSSFNKDGSNNNSGPASVQNGGSIRSNNSGNTSPPMDSGTSSQSNSNQDSGNSNDNSNQDSGVDSDNEDMNEEAEIESSTGTATTSLESFDVSLPRRKKRRKGISNDTFTVSIKVKTKRERISDDSTDGSFDDTMQEKVASLTSLQHREV
jgi:hypothetical protein